MIKFNTGGFRGIIGEDFIPENIVKIASGIVKYIRFKQYKNEVSLSYDFRMMSHESAILIAETLSAAGIKVYLSEQATPSPVAMYISKYLKIQIGIMITASHNPYDYNGIKLFENGMDASEQSTNILEMFINQDDILEKRNDIDIVTIDFLEPYYNFLKKFIHIKRKSDLKILVDFIYGTGVKTIPYFKTYYELNNLDTIRENQHPFFNHTLPNPLEEVIGVNRMIQKEMNYQLIVGLDSDADRLGIIDENGKFVDNNEILAVIYYYLVLYRNQKGDIVKNIATSNLIDVLAEKLGFKCHTVDVGFKNISAGILKHKALIGGESSGGLTIRDYIMGKDSTLSTLLIIEILTNLKQPFSKIVEEVRSFTNFHAYTIESEMAFKNKETVIKRINTQVKDIISYKELVSFNSNFKFMLDNNHWILLRFSGTEPLLRIFVETDDKSQSESYISKLKELLRGA